MNATVHTFSHLAMATRFEFRLVHPDAAHAAAAAAAISQDIDQLESELSRFVPYSDISRINGNPAGTEVMVHEAAIDCLQYGQEIWDHTGGAFDVTVGPLLEVLRGPGGFPRKPRPGELEAARARTGYHLLDIDAGEFTVIPRADNMQIDLGAIGKGYALDQAAILLREDWEISDFLLNAGTSTLLGSGSMPGASGWPVRAGDPEPFPLINQAVSGSGFEIQGTHIVNPRTARLVDISRCIRWAVAPNATLADALSTAFLVMTKREIAGFCRRHCGVRAIFS